MKSIFSSASLIGVTTAVVMAAAPASASLVPSPNMTQVYSGNDSKPTGQADFKSFVDLIGGFDSSTLV